MCRHTRSESRIRYGPKHPRSPVSGQLPSSRPSRSWPVRRRGVTRGVWRKEYAASRQRSRLSSAGGFCGIIVPFVKPVAEPSSNAGRVGFHSTPFSGFRRFFEFITNSIECIRIGSETSGPVRFHLPQPSWVYKMSAPAFCAEAAVVPFISELVGRRGHECKRGRSPTRTGRSPTSERGVSTDSAAHHRWGQHPIRALLYHRRPFEIQR